jgi:hypothetical protein
MTAGRQPSLRAREQAARRHAHHIALTVRKNEDGVYTLGERYGAKKKLGTYRSVDSLRRGIWRHHHRMMKELEREGVQ